MRNSLQNTALLPTDRQSGLHVEIYRYLWDLSVNASYYLQNIMENTASKENPKEVFNGNSFQHELDL